MTELLPPGPGPRGPAEVVTVSLDVPRHDVVAGEVDVWSTGEKTRHPGHITTWGVEEPSDGSYVNNVMYIFTTAGIEPSLLLDAGFVEGNF